MVLRPIVMLAAVFMTSRKRSAPFHPRTSPCLPGSKNWSQWISIPVTTIKPEGYLIMSPTKKSRLAAGITIAAILSIGLATGANAHVTLEQSAAPVGSFYKVVLRVPHGCEGSATTKITVHIPEGVISVKPMVKAGWTLAVTRGAYARPYSFLHGAKFTEGPKEISWSGGNLPDAYYDEFALTTFIAGELTAGGTLYFPVVQECEKGVHKWVDVPAPGKPADKLGDPAPGLKLLPKATGHGD